MSVFIKSFIIGTMFMGMAMFVPTVTWAQSTSSSTSSSPAVLDRLVNPLGTTDPRVIIANIIKAILSIVGSLALLMFVYGGFLWITSFGESKRIDRGKTILVWAVAGLAIIASSYVVVNAIILGLVTGKATP